LQLVAKTKPSYLTRSHTGSAWTLLLLVASLSLILSETRRWFAGTVSHSFSVEKGVSHSLQINIDVVIAMRCDDVAVNVQDAAGDRILAGELLHKDPTAWRMWGGTGRGSYGHEAAHTLEKGAAWGEGYGLGEEEDVHDYLGRARRKRKFAKTPRLRGAADACRVYGSLEGNKVQGDFHITARGHGYIEFGQHLDHSRKLLRSARNCQGNGKLTSCVAEFNFSHHINELSFGPFYPSLINPLDSTVAVATENFYKFQYYCNVVPTIYTTDVHRLSLSPPSGSTTGHVEPHISSSTVWTNQYSVTSQSHPVNQVSVPGIFVKYDIEPILLVVTEEWGGMLALVVRLVNVVSGVLVAGSWLWQVTDWAVEAWGGAGARERLGFWGTRDEKYV
jgi:hypothetical protein